MEIVVALCLVVYSYIMVGGTLWRGRAGHLPPHFANQLDCSGHAELDRRNVDNCWLTRFVPHHSNGAC